MKKYILKQKKILTLTTTFIIGKAMCNVLFAILIQRIVDTGTKGSLSDLKKWVIFIIIFSVAEPLFCLLIDVGKTSFKRKALVSLKNDIFNKILKRNIQHFNDVNTAEYISVLTNDISIIEQDYFDSFFGIITNIAVFVFGTVTLLSINVYITLAIFLTGGIMISLPMLFRKKLTEYKLKYSENLTVFTTKIKDMFSGFEVIKSYHIEDKTIQEFAKSNKDVENAKKNSTVLQSIVKNVVAGVPQNLMLLVTSVIGCYFVIKGQITMGYLFASLQLTNYTLFPLSDLVSNINKLKSIKKINEKIEKILKEEDEELSGLTKETFYDKLSFENITFSYNDNKNIFTNLSLTIEKGKKYAIVGGSGSGKSTLIKLMLRYYDNYTGTIKIDNDNVKDIKTSSLYNLMSIIHQNVFMFDDTIKNNITLFNDYSESEIYRAIELSGLSDFVSIKEKGFDSNVGENGCYLSGGEKQRLAIARAIIRQTPILILDEATSSLDNQNSVNIENSIFSLDYLTSIVITHKLIENMLNKYDEIIVLRNGQIEEIGNFEELIKNKGYFYSLYNVAQSN